MATDLLILTIYFICIVYVLYQMALSLEAKLEDQVNIVLDGEALQGAIAQQLAQQSPKATAQVASGNSGIALEMTLPTSEDAPGKVTIQASPQGMRPLQPPINDLKVTIRNELPDQQIFVNWDNSSLSVHGGLAERVIRKVPGMPVDLFQPQVMTVVNPKQAVSIAITSEALFKRPDNKSALESAPVLVDLQKVSSLKEPLRGYSLRVLLWVRSMTSPDGRTIQLLLPFNFHIEVLPEHVALPVLSWLLDLFSPKPKARSR